jgi:uncharacterized membrane protein YjjP (DUF1212 family)
LYRDCFKNLGWILIEEREGPLRGKDIPSSSHLNIALAFKRERKLKENAELQELQQQCERALASIERLERTVTARPTLYGLLVGLVGTGFVSGAVVSYQAGEAVLCAFLGAIGLFGWGTAYLLFDRIQSKVTAEVTPLLEAEYEVLYHICERASRLLA